MEASHDGGFDDFGECDKFGKILQTAKSMKAKHMEASHNGGFDDSGECYKFGKILPNCQVNAKKLNTWKPAMMADLTILANVTNLAKFCQTAKSMQRS